MDRTKQKITKETQELSNIISQLDITELENTQPNKNGIHILLKHTGSIFPG